MKLIDIISQHRRDFKGLYQCEKCKAEVKAYGYDDRNFHDNVTPKMKCKSCGETTESLGIEPERVATKYADYEIV